MPLPVRIERMLYGGSGVAENGSAFSFVLPGELVQPTAAAAAILEPSLDRTSPGCVHFGVCGGCHYQHAAYPAQLRMKETILRDTLAAAGFDMLPAIEVHSADPWRYRNRIRLRVGEVDGEIRLGYNRHKAAAGDPLLPIGMCPIASPLLWDAAANLMELAKTHTAVYPWLASAIELELFTNADQTALQLTLFTRKPSTTSFSAFCTILRDVMPQLAGAGVAILPKQPSPQGRRFERARPGPQWSAAGLIYTVDLDRHWVGRGAFFQVNGHLLSTLTRLATADRTGTLAWDLYAGVGLFSRALANSFQEVVAVEASEPAAAALKSALAAAPNGKNHSAIPATTLEFLQAAVVQRERPSLIIMDPPRAGVGPEVCALLARIRAPEVVYVSCDPVTLARDLKQLVNDRDAGYRLSALHLVDMFPQTFHMETVAVLHR